MSRIMLTFVGLALFCLLSLLTQDAALLTGGERLNVPFAGPVSFRAYLYGAQLMGANLFRADLEGANLEGARLTNFEYGGPANLEGANLEGANLEGAMNLIQMQVDRTCGDETTKLPEELSIRQCAK